MNSRYIPAALILSFMLAAPVWSSAADTKPAPAAQPAAPEQKAVKGKVAETIAGGGYTYLLVEGGEGKVWAAIPETKVDVGQEISLQPGMVMKSFESKALGRTFDQIIFSSGVENPAAAQAHPAAEPGAPVDEATLAALSGGSTRAVVPAGDGLKVDKAAGANARTVAECFENAATLDKQTVRIKGKVVKFSPQIMGKNWLHIQDGSGDPAKNTHDLVATTQEELKKDAIVTIEGVLTKDKDLGAGYKYAVLVEDVKVVP